MKNELNLFSVVNSNLTSEKNKVASTNSFSSNKSLPEIKDFNKRRSLLVKGTFHFKETLKALHNAATLSNSRVPMVSLSKEPERRNVANIYRPLKKNFGNKKKNFKASNTVRDFLKTPAGIQDEQFSFNINDYRRKSEKKTGQSKLKQILEDRRQSCYIIKKTKKRYKPNSIAMWRCFPILEQMIENSIIQFAKYDLLEGSATIQEKLIKELSKSEKEPDKITALLDNMVGFKKFMTTMGIQRKTISQAAAHLGLKYFHTDEFIFRQNDFSDFFYCIIQGKVELSKIKTIEIPNHLKDIFNPPSSFQNNAHLRRGGQIKKDKLIQEFDDPFTTLNEGQVFGEYGLIDKENSTRKASAKALIDTYLLTVDIACFKTYFKASIEKVFFDRKIFLLNHFPCFSSFSKEEFDRLYYKIIIMPFRNGQFIINEGDPADKIFIVLKGGSCKLSKLYKGENIHILSMQAGDIFGLESVCQRNVDEVSKQMLGKTPTTNEIHIETDKLARFTHSVTASSDDTSILKLELFKSTITMKSVFIQFLQSIFQSQNASIEGIFERSVGLKDKFKLNYTKNEIERKLNPQLVSKHLDNSIKEVESFRRSLFKTNTNKESNSIKYEISKINEPSKQVTVTANLQKLNPESKLFSNGVTHSRKVNGVNSSMDIAIQMHNKQIQLASPIKGKEACLTVRSERTQHHWSKNNFDMNYSLTDKALTTAETIPMLPLKNDKGVFINKVVKKRGTNFIIKSIEVHSSSQCSTPQNCGLTPHSIKFKTENFNLPLISQIIKVKK